MAASRDLNPAQVCGAGCVAGIFAIMLTVLALNLVGDGSEADGTI